MARKARPDIHVQGRALAHPVGQYRTPPRTCEPTVVAGHLLSRTPLPQPQHRGARDDTAPHRTDADSGATHARQEVSRGASHAPLPRGWMPYAGPARHQPLPDPHPSTRQGARYHTRARVRCRPPTPTPCPSPHPPGRAASVLAVRPTHRRHRTLRPRAPRHRPVNHHGAGARKHVQPLGSRASRARVERRSQATQRNA